MVPMVIHTVVVHTVDHTQMGQCIRKDIVFLIKNRDRGVEQVDMRTEVLRQETEGIVADTVADMLEGIAVGTAADMAEDTLVEDTVNQCGG